MTAALLERNLWGGVNPCQTHGRVSHQLEAIAIAPALTQCFVADRAFRHLRAWLAVKRAIAHQFVQRLPCVSDRLLNSLPPSHPD
ncbi:hypothetical protein JCM31271_21650 [Halorubrum trueperi]